VSSSERLHRERAPPWPPWSASSLSLCSRPSFLTSCKCVVCPRFRTVSLRDVTAGSTLVAGERRRELTVASPPQHPTCGRASPKVLPKPRSLQELLLTSFELEHTSSGPTGVGNGRYATVLCRLAAITTDELTPVTCTPTLTTLRCGLARGERGWPRFRQPAYRRRVSPASPSSSVFVPLSHGPLASVASGRRERSWAEQCHRAGPVRFRKLFLIYLIYFKCLICTQTL
jgi:hypothetical protein